MVGAPLLFIFVQGCVGALLQVDEQLETEVPTRALLKDLRFSRGGEGCGDPGDGWRSVGPSAVQLGPNHDDLWLCGRWETRTGHRHRVTGITKIAFLQDAPLTGEVHDSFKHDVAKAAFYVPMQPNQDPEATCRSMGPFWRLLDGSVTPSGRRASTVRVCIEVRSNLDSEFLTDISVFNYGTANKAECTDWVWGFDAFKLPGFHMEELADAAPLMCLRTASQKLAPMRLNALTGQRQDLAFPARNMPVGRDYGNGDREHIFVVGPEASGSRFWNYVVAVNSKLSPVGESASDFGYDKNTALLHFTMPHGTSSCQDVREVPVYNDFGGSVSSYALQPEAPTALKTVPQEARFNVDVANMVEEYRRRKDKIKVLLVVRNPYTNFQAKTLHNCGDRRKSRAEMKKAFELMSAASKYEEVHVACHEDLMSQGSKYVKATLRSMGVDHTFVPEVFGGDAMAQNPSFAATHCTQDMLQYMELCPNTLVSLKFSKICRGSHM